MNEIEREMILATQDNFDKQSDLIENQLDYFQNSFDEFIKENRDKNINVLETTEFKLKEMIKTTSKQFKRNTILTKALLGINALLLLIMTLKLFGVI